MSAELDTMFCEDCNKWSPVDSDVTCAYCAVCGEDFKCGECGHVVDEFGACQRPPDEQGNRCPESMET